jgi:hypothetical protein
MPPLRSPHHPPMLLFCERPTSYRRLCTTNVQDLLRANSLVQHTKNDIITEVKTIVRKEINHDLKDLNTTLTSQHIKLNREVVLLSAVSLFQSIAIFVTNIVMIHYM